MAQVVLKDIYKTFPSSARAAVQADSADGGEAQKDAQSDLPSGSVLRRINLTVDDGEFMVLVGPSGCGKSTLLRLISGLESLTSGDIWVGDRQVNRLPPKQRDIAMVFQSYALYPHLSVYDNLAFGLRRTRLTATDQAAKPSPRRPAWLESALTGLTRPLPRSFRYRSAAENQIAQRVRSVAQMLQIEALLSRLPKQLSGGQKQRVALGRAMARNPQAFLMDEPLSNLDAKLRTETRAQIVNLQRQLGTTTIYVTHDQTEAMTMGDRIAVMNQGEIQQVAPPLALYRQPANRFVAAFIGSPPMNFLTATVKAGCQLVHPAFTLSLPGHWHQTLAPYQDQTVTLGMRPEHITTGQQPGSVPVTVTQFEALGSETFVMATFANDSSAQPSLQVRVSAEQPVQIGGTLQISFPAEQIHLFDTLTEIAIRPDST